MHFWFFCWFTAVIIQRLLELRVAKRNTLYIQRVGGYEVGANHYPQIVGLHVAFFIFLLAEYAFRQPVLELWMIVPLCFFLLLQAARIWCIRSLGPHWNTRIYIVPGARLVRRGPYRWLRHPNYVVVTLELFVFPLLFGCFLTAAAFPLLNLIVLRKRIAVEDQALRATAAHPSR
jgi:methyltransferase